MSEPPETESAPTIIPPPDVTDTIDATLDSAEAVRNKIHPSVGTDSDILVTSNSEDEVINIDESSDSEISSIILVDNEALTEHFLKNKALETSYSCIEIVDLGKSENINENRQIPEDASVIEINSADLEQQLDTPHNTTVDTKCFLDKVMQYETNLDKRQPIDSLLTESFDINDALPLNKETKQINKLAALLELSEDIFPESNKICQTEHNENNENQNKVKEPNKINILENIVVKRKAVEDVNCEEKSKKTKRGKKSGPNTSKADEASSIKKNVHIKKRTATKNYLQLKKVQEEIPEDVQASVSKSNNSALIVISGSTNQSPESEKPVQKETIVSEDPKQTCSNPGAVSEQTKTPGEGKDNEKSPNKLQEQSQQGDAFNESLFDSETVIFELSENSQPTISKQPEKYKEKLTDNLVQPSTSKAKQKSSAVSEWLKKSDLKEKTCAICNKKVVDLGRHIYDVHDEKNEVCEFCGARYKRKSHKTQHIRTCHSSFL